MHVTTGTIDAAAGARARLDAGTWLAALVAALLGAFILYGVGFANSATLHEAAHDARHAFTFPCH